jgi:hypothetical protein
LPRDIPASAKFCCKERKLTEILGALFSTPGDMFLENLKISKARCLVLRVNSSFTSQNHKITKSPDNQCPEQEFPMLVSSRASIGTGFSSWLIVN